MRINQSEHLTNQYMYEILALSKLLMYDFHYNYSKRKYDTNLLFTDTSSLVYEIKTNDVLEDFYKGFV